MKGGVLTLSRILFVAVGEQNFGVEPDMMTVAKPLAGGLPIGAVLMKQHVADAMAPGAAPDER